MNNYERVLREIGYRCQKCTQNINDRCEIYKVLLSSDDGCYDHYKPKTNDTPKGE